MPIACFLLRAFLPVLPLLRIPTLLSCMTFANFYAARLAVFSGHMRVLSGLPVKDNQQTLILDTGVRRNGFNFLEMDFKRRQGGCGARFDVSVFRCRLHDQRSFLDVRFVKESPDIISSFFFGLSATNWDCPVA